MSAKASRRHSYFEGCILSFVRHLNRDAGALSIAQPQLYCVKHDGQCNEPIANPPEDDRRKVEIQRYKGLER